MAYGRDGDANHSNAHQVCFAAVLTGGALVRGFDLFRLLDMHSALYILSAC